MGIEQHNRETCEEGTECRICYPRTRIVDVGVRPPANPVHLGDGAYAEFDGYQIWVRANSHDPRQCTGQVALEPGAFRNLMMYARSINYP